MNILDKIIASKYREVEERKVLYPVSELQKSKFFKNKPLSLKKEILRAGSLGIIAEFKRCSPSAGIINETSLVWKVCAEYIEAGSSAVSVLTDTEFFGGSTNDLTDVRLKINQPVLRKDFIIDEYQIIEARANGADAILLIAELHRAERLEQLHNFARSIGLEVLMEIHDDKNISCIPPDAEIIGINSRNLGTFSVNLEHLNRIIQLLPDKTVKVAESGIRSVNDYLDLRNAGFDAFLIGEFFMRTANPGLTCRKFIDEIRTSPLNHLYRSKE